VRLKGNNSAAGESPHQCTVDRLNTVRRRMLPDQGDQPEGQLE